MTIAELHSLGRALRLAAQSIEAGLPLCTSIVSTLNAAADVLEDPREMRERQIKPWNPPELLSPGNADLCSASIVPMGAGGRVFSDPPALEGDIVCYLCGRVFDSVNLIDAAIVARSEGWAWDIDALAWVCPEHGAGEAL